MFILPFVLWCGSWVVAAGLAFTDVRVEYGVNLGEKVPLRIQNYLEATSVPVYALDDPTAPVMTSTSLVLSLGDATLALQYLDVTSLPAESFRIKSTITESGSLLLTCNGQPIMDAMSPALDVTKYHYGAIAGAYATLEMLGFAFLHPLSPYIPSDLILDDAVDVTESPYWPKRMWHVHTEHPLEFTEVLNGFDVPMTGDCVADRPCESWEDMFKNLDGLFEWLVANRQNRVESLLLGSPKWGDLTAGSKRHTRLSQLTTLAHQYSILIGADVPIANRQQHGWFMIHLYTSDEQQKQDIEDRLDWVFSAGYDFISTEAGLSEFTKPSCDQMLSLFNVYTNYAAETWKRESYTKVHCSTNQFCTETNEDGSVKYPDPRTGEPINFNFLPTYAESSLGAMPHTVQVYSFDDPTAGSYGNDNFTYVADYMQYESSLQHRDVLYYAETAYWVNVDVDVPLFLPIAGQKRLYDLRRTARHEQEDNFRISGQNNFESGWEFAYYISNVVTARAAWNPSMHFKDEYLAYRHALQPITSMFGVHGAAVAGALVDLVKTQNELLIYGEVGGAPSKNITFLSGHSYFSGSDTWVDLPRILGLSFTQPDKVHLWEVDHPQWSDVMPLLLEMKELFQRHDQVFQRILLTAKGSLNESALRYLEEIVDCVSLFALRIEHASLLYESTDSVTSGADRHDLLLRGRQLLHRAESVMSRRVDAFRVPVSRIAGWRQGPTVYPYGYVWAAKTLYYWWRDQGIAENKSALSQSPCYLNRIEPLETILGWGKVLEQALRIKFHSENNTNLDLLAPCLAPPFKEYSFPHDL